MVHGGRDVRGEGGRWEMGRVEGLGEGDGKW